MHSVVETRSAAVEEASQAWQVAREIANHAQERSSNVVAIRAEHVLHAWEVLARPTHSHYSAAFEGLLSDYDEDCDEDCSDSDASDTSSDTYSVVSDSFSAHDLSHECLLRMHWEGSQSSGWGGTFPPLRDAAGKDPSFDSRWLPPVFLQSDLALPGIGMVLDARDHKGLRHPWPGPVMHAPSQ